LKVKRTTIPPLPYISNFPISPAAQLAPLYTVGDRRSWSQPLGLEAPRGADVRSGLLRPKRAKTREYQKGERRNGNARDSNFVSRPRKFRKMFGKFAPFGCAARTLSRCEYWRKKKECDFFFGFSPRTQKWVSLFRLSERNCLCICVISRVTRGKKT
jgi:hypothetical protein